MPHDQPLAMLTTSALAAWSGVVIIAVSRRLQLPAIVFLLIAGALLGPAGVGLVRPDALGAGLRVIVALAVGLILFEGGLALDLSGYRAAPKMIRRLLSLGLLVTLLGGTAAIHWLAGLRLTEAFIAASLTTVTGPTVIAPLLKRLQLQKKLHAVLHWEGVLIDPIGVFIALLCFEWLGEGHGIIAFVDLGIRLLAGVVVGVPAGLGLAVLIHRHWLPRDIRNVFVLTSVLVVYGAAELVRSEAGLLAVTCAGFVLGIRRVSGLVQLKEFKAEIADLLIGSLFILLAARLEVAQFTRFGVGGALAVAAMMLVVRPASIGLCSWGLGFTWRERLFLSWIAPRGIVAASMASLISLRLEEIGATDRPRFAETFAYSVIIATVLLQGLTAKPLARWLRLSRPSPTGWVLVGAHTFARQLAKLIAPRVKDPVVLVDNNPGNVRGALAEGCAAVLADARDTKLLERYPGIKCLVAMSPSDDLNARVCSRWGDVLGRDQVYRMDLGVDDAEADGGQIVWPGLEGPEAVSFKLEHGDEGLALVRGVPSSKTRVLGWWRNGDLVLEGGHDGGVRRPAGAPALVLQALSDHLLESLSPHLIEQYAGTNPTELYGRLVERLVRVEPSLDLEATLKALLEREREAPSVMGAGVAIPHVYRPNIGRRLCAVAQVAAGLELKTPDAQRVRLVFLLVSPEGDAEGHLAALADIAHLVTSQHARGQLLAAKSPAEIVQIIEGHWDLHRSAVS